MSELETVHMFPGLEPLRQYNAVIFLNQSAKFSEMKNQKLVDGFTAFNGTVEADISWATRIVYLKLHETNFDDAVAVTQKAVEIIKPIQGIWKYHVMEFGNRSEGWNGEHNPL
jgi:hypothetical protein